MLHVRSAYAIEQQPADVDGQSRPVSLLVNILSGGGAQRRIATLANRFAEIGQSVDVVSVYPKGPMSQMLAPEVRLITLAEEGMVRPPTTVAHTGRLAEYLKVEQPEALMSCVTDVHLMSVAAVAIGGRSVPLVMRASRHPYRELPRDRRGKRALEPLIRWKTARIYHQADAIVTLSPDNASGMRRLLGEDAPPIETILNPVVRAIDKDALGARNARQASNEPLILGVGRLVEQKDFATLIRAFAIVRRQRGARLTILGSGEQAVTLRDLAARLGIADWVNMPGQVNNVGDWIKRADLVVSSSLWEGLQATLIEAMAAGCPVVATDCPGGARDTLKNGTLGPLVPVGDPEAMAQAMIAQLETPVDPATLADGVTPFLFDGKAEAYLDLFSRCRARVQSGTERKTLAETARSVLAGTGCVARRP